MKVLCTDFEYSNSKVKFGASRFEFGDMLNKTYERLFPVHHRFSDEKYPDPKVISIL